MLLSKYADFFKINDNGATMASRAGKETFRFRLVC